MTLSPTPAKAPAYSEEQADLYSEPREKIVGQYGAVLKKKARARKKSTQSMGEGYTEAVDAECDHLVNKAKTADDALLILPRLKELAAFFPDELKPNLSYVSVRELTRQKEGLFEAWCDLHARFPESDKALRYRMRWLKRRHCEEEGRALIESLLPGILKTYATLEQKAELYSELRDPEETRRYYALLVEHYSDDPRSRFHFAKWLHENGYSDEAWNIYAPAENHPQMPPSGIQFGQCLREGLETLHNFKSSLGLEEKNSNILALAYALEMFASKRQNAPKVDRLGGSAFITGSLGPGGAERQMARTVERLELARSEGRSLNGVELDGPFDIVVKSLDEKVGHNFFLAKVLAAGARTFQIDNIPPQSFTKLHIEDAALASLMTFLPPSVSYGVQRMISYFRDENVQVAYIWQDGAVLFAALAAMMAGVPRIVISMRGLPPILRLHMMRPEYYPMYHALAQVPGVYFVSNNRVSAEAYCDWIGIAREKFSIIYNGVDFLPPEGEESDHRRWAVFARRTGGVGVPTIGGVFRFDTDKRPLLWIDFARDYLVDHPTARFVLVGGGRLLAEARARAATYGIAERILFVGLSPRVGYWLTKMDVFVLLSHYEGLPNAIIEAQLSGVPVVATPAGGTCEAMEDGVGGLLLSSAESFELSELCDKVHEVYQWRVNDPSLGSRLSAAASDRFSTRRMVERTAFVLAGGEDSAHV